MKSMQGLAAAVLGAAILVAACSSSDSGGDGSHKSPTGPQPTGKPLVVYSLYDIPDSPVNAVVGINAAIAEINNAGGVGGRPIKLAKACVSNNQPNAAATCARTAAQDSNALAELGVSSFYGDAEDPIFQDADLPNIGSILGVPADYTSPVAFAVNSGTQSVAGQAALAADSLGAKTISLLCNDSPSGRAVPNSVQEGVLKPRNLEFSASAFIPPTGAGDVAPQIAALGKSDAQVQCISGSNVPNAVNTARHLGYTNPIILASNVISPSQIKKQIQDTSNLYTVQFYKLFGTGYDAYEDAMGGIGEKGGKFDTSGSITGYLAVHLFADTVKALQASGKEITRKNILAQLRATSDYDTGGLTPPLSWSKKSTVLGGKMPNLINPTVVGYKYNDGQYERLNNGEFIEIYH
jgi:ABC-type branched-subunit amino acid transport system substrate-binding protein